MAIPDNLHVEFVEKEIFKVELKTIDAIPGTGLGGLDLSNKQDGDILVYNAIIQKWQNKSVMDVVEIGFVYGETPTQLTSKRFKTAFPFSSGTLRILFNGIREKNITIHTTTEFSFGINIIASDEILVDYIK